MTRLTVALLFLFAGIAQAGRIHPEGYYQQSWCAQAGGVSEVVLDDKTRADCLTDEYAVEVDFAAKWAEAVGQSLHYAHKTGRRPGVLLILETHSDERHLEKLRGLAALYNITIWTARSGQYFTRLDE